MKLSVLRKRSDFLRVSEHARKTSTKAATKTFTLIAAPAEHGFMQIGYTVTKQTSKLAVERNRIKRRLRAIIAEILPAAARPGFDYVIIGKRDCLTRDYKDLKGDLKYALKKLFQA